jgi:hypothetical protein
MLLGADAARDAIHRSLLRRVEVVAWSRLQGACFADQFVLRRQPHAPQQPVFDERIEGALAQARASQRIGQQHGRAELQDRPQCARSLGCLVLELQQLELQFALALGEL